MKIAILTPVGRQLSTDHQRCIDALQGQSNIVVLREYGISCVDQARALLLERARAGSADVYLWIDDDIAFNPIDVESVAKRCYDGEYDILGVAYSRRVPAGGMNVRFARSGKITFFQPGFEDAIDVGFGFTAMKRNSIERLIAAAPRAQLGVIRDGVPMHIGVSPVFASRIVDGRWLADDESFCRYATEAGLHIGVDLEPRIWHLGNYNYGLEDAVSGVGRAGTLIVDMVERTG